MTTFIRPLYALAVVLAGVSTTRAGAPAGKAEVAKPLPQDVVTAWRKAGAEVGWLRAERYRDFDGVLVFEGYFRFVPEQKGKPGDLPAFRFTSWQPGCLAKLPSPATAFGLDLVGSGVTAAGLKELSRLKSLQALDLCFTQVTDTGFRELRQLTSLQDLGLEYAHVTGACATAKSRP
jgi:hypothetical protein